MAERSKRVSIVARCIVCACTDERACTGGCFWVAVDRSKGIGVCSSASCIKKAGLNDLLVLDIKVVKTFEEAARVRNKEK